MADRAQVDPRASQFDTPVGFIKERDLPAIRDKGLERWALENAETAAQAEQKRIGRGEGIRGGLMREKLSLNFRGPRVVPKKGGGMTEAGYDNDFERARQLLEPRLAAKIRDSDSDDPQFMAKQLGFQLRDALTNTWEDGITPREWMDRAAGRLGLPKVPSNLKKFRVV